MLPATMLLTAQGVCLLLWGTSMFELFDPDADFCVSEGANLPHWYQPGVTYFVTFRTEDSIPADVGRRWHASRDDWLRRHGVNPNLPDWHRIFDSLPTAHRKEFHETFSHAYLENLDRGWGACVLRHPEAAKTVADSILHFDGDRYHVGDFVVMPNHVHLLVCLIGATEIQAQCYSWKKFTATKINRMHGRTGRFWQEESFDHLVRSPEQLEAIRKYIAKNPTQLKPGEYFLYSK